ncbi:ornithine carbamoyltransferase [Alterisphingorhabdus coralli]|uniref:Ornithine carbamoyltransferase n=1 Tax=Alterisphingorhabdus coralli TaxID=3071408 RepID=A0AA97I1X8_9SPHN|nr:ornithine carbamoyltransferase [Parasphingorhabdus sp. SCSIO 66989]WOE75780.1 ornithine carbamoyltransferase [Parasphingorhabdus sp. SCSIO 66989]
MTADMRHFLNLSDAGPDAVAAMLNDAIDRKAARAHWPRGRQDSDAPLDGHVLAMVFEKSSTRTRVSFDMAIRQLGGSAVVLDAGTTQLGRGETVADTARVLSRMADVVMLRTDDHQKVEDMARHATVPIINGLTDLSHPCQIMADLLTIIEAGKALPGLELAWLGDGNNVTNSIIEAAGMMFFNVRIGVPPGYEPDAGFIARARAAGSAITITHDPVQAVKGADVVVTDTWVSMGQEDSEAKLAAMMPFQVNEALMAHARDNALFLHCLPAHRGEEATDGVLDGAQSAIWDEAENRIHAQKSILRWVFGQI